VDSLLSGLTSQEAVEWLASARLDPDEADRADIRHAFLVDSLVRLLARPKRGQRLNPPPVSSYLADLPWRAEHKPERPATPAQLRRKIDAAMTMLGGKRVR
jgi:hypothetical protein